MKKLQQKKYFKDKKERNKKKISKKILTLAMTTLFSNLALADDFSFFEENKNYESLGETIVTVNKIEENLKNIPQSITVIDSEVIKEKEIKDVPDIIKEIPNMNSSKIRGTLASFRGLNSSMFTSNNPIVIYIDGVPYYDRYDFEPSLNNVKQVEVLRGPQGTLYGKDAIGAVINIITKEPENEWNGNIDVEYGNNNYMETALNASGALIKDKLFLGINGSFTSDDGWITNNYPGMDENADKSENRKASTFLLFKPRDNFEGKLTITNNYGEKNFMNGFATDNSVSVNDISRDDAENVSFDMPSYEKARTKSESLNLVYDMKNIKIETATTHKKFNVDGDYDSDFRANRGYYDGLSLFDNTNIDTWTQEIKFSDENQKIKWIAGIYGDKEERKQGPFGQEFPKYVNSTYLGNFIMNEESVTKSYTQAVFGQAMIPFGDVFELTLGGRYQKIDKEINLDMYFHTIGTTTNPIFAYNDKKTWNAFLPKAAFSYKYGENLTVYTSVSKGYMPGGFNYLASSGASEENSFDPQTSINYEIGTKYSGDKYVINASVFRMDIEDIHVYKSINTSSFVTDNAEKAHSQGIEIEGKYYLANHIELSGAIGLIDAKYDSYDAGTKKFDGEKIQNTPEYNGNLGVAYVTNRGIYGRVDAEIVGKTNYYDSANYKMVEVDGAIISNAKLGYKNKSWDIYGYIKNITDESYICGYLSRPGTAMIEFNNPRTFGIGVKCIF